MNANIQKKTIRLNIPDIWPMKNCGSGIPEAVVNSDLAYYLDWNYTFGLENGRYSFEVTITTEDNNRYKFENGTWIVEQTDLPITTATIDLFGMMRSEFCTRHPIGFSQVKFTTSETSSKDTVTVEHYRKYFVTLACLSHARRDPVVAFKITHPTFIVVPEIQDIEFPMNIFGETVPLPWRKKHSSKSTNVSTEDKADDGANLLPEDKADDEANLLPEDKADDEANLLPEDKEKLLKILDDFQQWTQQVKVTSKIDHSMLKRDAKYATTIKMFIDKMREQLEILEPACHKITKYSKSFFEFEKKFETSVTPLVEKYGFCCSKRPVLADNGNEKEYEQFIKCKFCSREWHKMCIRPVRQDDSVEFICDTCRVSKNLPKDSQSHLSARNLPTTPMDEIFERKVNKILAEKFEDEYNGSPIPKMIIRMLSNCKKTFDVGEKYKKHMKLQHNKVEYTSKVLCVFQEFAGLETLIFAIYTQEYSSKCKLESNKSLACISSIDCLHHFGSPKFMDFTLHTLIIEYMECIRLLKFKKVHFMPNCFLNERSRATFENQCMALLNEGQKLNTLTSYKNWKLSGELKSIPVNLPYCIYGLWPAVFEEHISTDGKTVNLESLRDVANKSNTIIGYLRRPDKNDIVVDSTEQFTCALFDTHQSFGKAREDQKWQFGTTKQAQYATMCILHTLHNSTRTPCHPVSPTNNTLKKLPVAETQNIEHGVEKGGQNDVMISGDDQPECSSSVPTISHCEDAVHVEEEGDHRELDIISPSPKTLERQLSTGRVAAESECKENDRDDCHPCKRDKPEDVIGNDEDDDDKGFPRKQPVFSSSSFTDSFRGHDEQEDDHPELDIVSSTPETLKRQLSCEDDEDEHCPSKRYKSEEAVENDVEDASDQQPVCRSPSPNDSFCEDVEQENEHRSFTSSRIGTHDWPLTKDAFYQLLGNDLRKILDELIKMEESIGFVTKLSRKENIRAFMTKMSSQLDEKVYKTLAEIISDFHSGFRSWYPSPEPKGSKKWRTYNNHLSVKSKFVELVSDHVEKLGMCCTQQYIQSVHNFFCQGCPKLIRKGTEVFLYVESGNDGCVEYDEEFSYCADDWKQIEKDGLKMPGEDRVIPPSAFSKKPNNETVLETIERCAKCPREWHRVCAMQYSSVFNEEFICPTCRSKESLPMLEIQHKAVDLPKTDLSEFMEQQTAKFLNADQTFDAEPIIIRVLFSQEHKFQVSESVPKTISKDYTNLSYWSRAIFAFQKIDGVEVAFFGMRVQEYGSNAPPGLKNLVNISYLDSVRLIEPSKLRTEIFRSIVLAYFDYMRMIGMENAHIWARPPIAGEDYLFHSHPNFQQYPVATKLTDWYVKLLEDGIKKHIVKEYHQITAEECDNLANLPFCEDGFFEDVLSRIVNVADASELIANKLNSHGVFSIELNKSQTSVVAEPEQEISSDLFALQSTFLLKSRKEKWEFATLQQAKFSTMSFVRFLHEEIKKRQNF